MPPAESVLRKVAAAFVAHNKYRYIFKYVTTSATVPSYSIFQLLIGNKFVGVAEVMDSFSYHNTRVYFHYKVCCGTIRFAKLILFPCVMYISDFVILKISFL